MLDSVIIDAKDSLKISVFKYFPVEEVSILCQVYPGSWGQLCEQDKQNACLHTAYVQEKYRQMERGKMEKNK